MEMVTSKMMTQNGVKSPVLSPWKAQKAPTSGHLWMPFLLPIITICVYHVFRPRINQEGFYGTFHFAVF